MATMLPSQGNTLQPRMPETRLTMARGLVWRGGVLIDATPYVGSAGTATGSCRREGQAAVAQGVGPGVETAAARPFDGRGVVVLDRDQFRPPGAAVAVQHRISRRGSPALHDVRVGMAAAEGRQADAPRIHAQPAIVQAQGARHVGM